MAKDLNQCNFIGRLAADPEMRYTSSGGAVTNFRIAVGRSWKNQSGEVQEETEWVGCVAWDKLGEICNQYLSKGSRIHITGRMKTRSWDDATSGEKRYKTEIVLTDMIMLDTKRSDKAASDYDDEAPAEDEAPPARRPAAPAKAAAPAARPAAPAKAAANRNRPQPIESDDDIPF